MPPPLLLAVLLDKTQSETVSAPPSLKIPPPNPRVLAAALPLAMVKPEMPTVAPELTVKMLPAVADIPETVMTFAPGPVMVI